jgi:hypothetical protein
MFIPQSFTEMRMKVTPLHIPIYRVVLVREKPWGIAMYMAQSALAQWVGYLTDKKQTIPNASPAEKIKPSKGDFLNLIRVEVKDAKAVKRTVSIPKWMDDQVSQSGLSLSRVLQDALREKLA